MVWVEMVILLLGLKLFGFAEYIGAHAMHMGWKRTSWLYLYQMASIVCKCLSPVDCKLHSHVGRFWVTLPRGAENLRDATVAYFPLNWGYFRAIKWKGAIFAEFRNTLTMLIGKHGHRCARIYIVHTHPSTSLMDRYAQWPHTHILQLDLEVRSEMENGQ